MQRVTKAWRTPSRKRPGIVVRRNDGSRSAERTAAATDIALLGQGCGESLPSLRRIPRAIGSKQTANASTVCACAGGAESGRRELWQKTGKVAVVFVRSAIQHLIEEFTGDALEGKVDYCFEVRDDLGQDIGGAELLAKAS